MNDFLSAVGSLVMGGTIVFLILLVAKEDFFKGFNKGIGKKEKKYRSTEIDKKLNDVKKEAESGGPKEVKSRFKETFKKRG